MDLALLVLLPIALLLAAAVAATLSVRRSSVRIGTDGVEIRNWGMTPELVPLERVVRFEEPVAVGSFAGLRPKTAVLVLTDGTRRAVRSLSDPEAGTGIDALNARLAALRKG